MNKNFKRGKKSNSENKNTQICNDKPIYETEFNILSTENKINEKSLPNINNNDFNDKKYSKIEKRTSSLPLPIVSPVNKDSDKLLTEELIKIKSNEFQPERIKTFKIKNIDNWFRKNGFLEPNVKLGLDPDFQKSLISDEIKVILDSIQYFKLSCLNTKNSYILFNNFAYRKQVEFNKVIEETCGLLTEICTLILDDFK